MRKYKVCVFTGTRAEYGLLKPLMEEIQKQPEFELQLIVSGMHLSPEFGLTYKEIEKDGFVINEKVEILLSSDTSIGVSKAVGLGVISFSECLERLKPDIAIVLGDRFEAFAFAVACYISKIPLAHLYGGEITEGSLDDGFRHAITKLAYLHFTSTENYRRRVIQLGECPDRVFNVGALGIDNILRMKFLSREEVERRLNIKFNKYNFLITFHPETISEEETINHFSELLSALDELENATLIFTKANADQRGRKINKMIDEFVSKKPYTSVSFTSMGQLLYLSTMQYVDAVIGNSSSGIIEAPSLKVATINVGDRQKGRIKAKSVVDCNANKEEILKAIKIVTSNDFKERLKTVENPYGDGYASKKIVSILKGKLPIINLNKKFFDLQEVKI